MSNTQELHKIVWKSANELKGSVDDWDFKGYILGFLFYRYISESFEKYAEEYFKLPNYSSCQDDNKYIQSFKQDISEMKGYFIYPSQTFSRVKEKSQNDYANLNEEIRKIFDSIEDSTIHLDSKNNFLKLLRSIETSNDKLGKEVIEKNKKLQEILRVIGNINIDLDKFKNIYEYLIGKYSSKAGKKGGEFYTPPNVSKLLAEISATRDNPKNPITTIYDFACGSGSLLLKFLKILPSPEDLEFYGQELNPQTYNFCRMNMFLNDVGYEKFFIEQGDTLLNDKFANKKFDVIVSNPQFSAKWNNEGLQDDPRFCKCVVPPKSKADWAFILHALCHLENDGIAVMVCFPGCLYRTAEAKIRQYFVDQNYIDAIISLPENLFFRTSIEACVIVLKKSKPETEILFIDAQQYFEKSKNNNILMTKEIVDIYKNRKDIENISRLVSHQEIKEKDYTLSVNSYVKKKAEKEEIDIFELNKSIRESRNKIGLLMDEIDELIKQFEC